MSSLDGIGIDLGISLLGFGKGSKHEKTAKTNGKTVIFDLDETLIRTHNDCKNMFKTLEQIKDVDDKKRTYVIRFYDGKYGTWDQMWGFLRPHVKELLIYCLENFELVIIWTAGTKEYAREIKNVLFKNLTEPDLVYSREHCEKIKEVVNGKLKVVDYHKPIDKLIREQSKFKGVIRMDNTILVDNKKLCFEQNSGRKNGIWIPDYVPEDNADGLKEEDNHLLTLIDFFKSSEFINATDVRDLKLKKIFRRKE